MTKFLSILFTFKIVFCLEISPYFMLYNIFFNFLALEFGYSDYLSYLCTVNVNLDL